MWWVPREPTACSALSQAHALVSPSVFCFLGNQDKELDRLDEDTTLSQEELVRPGLDPGSILVGRDSSGVVSHPQTYLALRHARG